MHPAPVGTESVSCLKYAPLAGQAAEDADLDAYSHNKADTMSNIQGSFYVYTRN